MNWAFIMAVASWSVLDRFLRKESVPGEGSTHCQPSSSWECTPGLLPAPTKAFLFASATKQKGESSKVEPPPCLSPLLKDTTQECAHPTRLPHILGSKFPPSRIHGEQPPLLFLSLWKRLFQSSPKTVFYFPGCVLTAEALKWICCWVFL